MYPRVIIVVIIGLLLGYSPQRPGFANQAISRVKQLFVSQLESGLPERPFSSWFQQVVGQGAGLSYQLTDCGESPASSGSGVVIQACVETAAILPDKRKVVVVIWVGDFKRGLVGKPRLRFVIVDNEDEIVEARSLSDLPRILRMPLPRQPMKTPKKVTTSPVVLPIVGYKYFAPTVQSLPSRATYIQAREISVLSREDIPLKVSDGVLIGNVIRKVIPRYPSLAQQTRVSGEVKVDITVDVAGRVIAAKAVSGPYPLYMAAEDAAMKWIFSSTLLNNVPVSVRGVLTFIFTQP